MGLHRSRPLTLSSRLGMACTALLLTGVAAPAGKPPLPVCNLTIEVRAVVLGIASQGALSSEPSGAPPGLTVSSRQAEREPVETQQVRVLNGERAALRLSSAVPFTWVQAVAGRAVSPPAAKASAAGTDASLVNAVTWLPRGQSLAVQPSWPGGQADVKLVMAWALQQIDDSHAGLPTATGRQAQTTLAVPINQWTTFATSGQAEPAPTSGVWSTQSLRARIGYAWQVRVLDR